jgi:hypothetical protein
LHAALSYPAGSSAISLDADGCGVSLVILSVVSVGSVVSEAVVVGPDDDVSSGLTSHQMPNAPRTRTNTPAAAVIGIHGTLLPWRGGPGVGGAAVHIGPLGGRPVGGGGVVKATGRAAGCGEGVAPYGRGVW